jgi:hypothetical protein
MANYPLLDIYAFGEQLLRTKDIDPVYVVLDSAGWSNELKARWCLAYWCTYHVGVASYVASHTGDAYWSVLAQVAVNETPAPTGGRWPRGKERRHWRGKQAYASWTDLARRYAQDPSLFVATLANPKTFISIGTLGAFDPAPIPYAEVAKAVKVHVGFGSWMAFKIADMLEQVFNIPVDFDNAAVFMFKDPKEAALRFWRFKYKLPENARPNSEDDVINKVVDHLVDHFSSTSQFTAPTGRRLVGLQEVETILCKWKSHINGHYPLNNDIEELRHAAEAWAPYTSLAKAFIL